MVISLIAIFNSSLLKTVKKTDPHTVMNRKEFLVLIWRKGLKPILSVSVIYFCSKILYTIISGSKPERPVVMLVIGLGLILASVYLIKTISSTIVSKINPKFLHLPKIKLPKIVKLWIRVILKIIDFIAPVILGIMIYRFWLEDWIATSLVTGIFLIQMIFKIIKGEKQSINGSKTSNS